MDDNLHRENGRHKTDHYKAVHAQQWMMPQHHVKDNHTMKLMALMNERDNAIQERNLALAEKRAAFVERDMAVAQRDGVIEERNAAIMERDNALAALNYTRDSSMNGNAVPGCTAHRGTKHFDLQQSSDTQDNHSREMVVKVRKAKRPTKVQSANPVKKVGKDLNEQGIMAKPLNEWCNFIAGGEDLNKHDSGTSYNELKCWDLALNQIAFDESMMPPPGCSCTGKLQQCYKWGSGGWQSACCTTLLSVYPLPVMPNKRHGRVAGRKMSSSAFTKLLSRLSAEGHDLSATLDLKDRWSKHGTNRDTYFNQFTDGYEIAIVKAVELGYLRKEALNDPLLINAGFSRMSELRRALCAFRPSQP